MTIPDRKAEIRKRHADQAADIAGYLDWQQMAVMYRDVSDLLSMLDAVESERDQLKRLLLEFVGRCLVDALMSGPRFKGFNRSIRSARTVEDLLRDANDALSTPAQVPATKEV